MTTNKAQSDYTPRPKKRRGNRRATGGDPAFGQEPNLAGWEKAQFSEPADLVGEDDTAQRDRWLKEQKPPHHEL